jgi:hypothetical protein
MNVSEESFILCYIFIGNSNIKNCIDVDLSRKDIADFTGTTAEQVTHVFKFKKRMPFQPPEKNRISQNGCVSKINKRT